MVWTRKDSLLMNGPSLLAAEFRPQAYGLIEGARALKLPFKVWETLRDHRRQAAYYAEGRTAGGDIITNAKPGESPHEWGYALDMVLDLPGHNPWAGCKSRAEMQGGKKPTREELLVRQEVEPYWKQLAALARELGITSGYNNWGWDWPHFQMKNWLVHRPDDWRELVRYRLERAKGD